MRIEYTKAIRTMSLLPQYSRFPSGAKQIAWWKVRITWNDPHAKWYNYPLFRVVI